MNKGKKKKLIFFEGDIENYFLDFGEIEEVRVIQDGKNKDSQGEKKKLIFEGFGYVLFRNAKALCLAMKEDSQHIINGYKVKNIF